MKRYMSWLAILAGGVLVASCGGAAPAQGPAAAPPAAADTAPAAPAAPAAERPRLTIAMPSVGIQTMAVTTAAQGGFFDKHGLDVTLAPMADARQVMMAMVQGRADLAVVPPGLAIQSRNSPRPLVAIGAVTGSTSLNVVVASKVARERGLTAESPLLERSKALKGLRIGYPGGGSLGINTAKAVVEASGLDPARDVELVPLAGEDPGKEQLSALDRGDIDGFVGHHPYLEQAIVGQGAMLLLHLSGGEIASAGSFPHHLLVVPAGSALGKDALTAVLAAVAETQRAIHDDPSVAMKALRSAFPDLSEPLLEQSMRIYVATVPATPVIARDDFETALRLFGLAAIPFDEVVDNSFAEAR